MNTILSLQFLRCNLFVYILPGPAGFQAPPTIAREYGNEYKKENLLQEIKEEGKTMEREI